VSSVSELVINGGDFRVSALEGAGIGAGPTLGGTSVVDNLTIRHGTFFLSGHWGAGIGTSSANSGSSIVKNLLIVNGTFHANGSRASGIGSAWVSTGESSLNNITILGGRFNLVGENDGAGLGAGPGQAGRSTVSAISIKGGNITATGVNAGVGVGSLYWGNTSRVGSVTIGGASVSTHGLYGFSATQVHFGDGDVTLDCNATGDVCVDSPTTVLSSGRIIATTNSVAFGYGNWRITRGATFYGQYSIRSLMEGLEGVPFLHIVNVSAPRQGGLLLSVENAAYRSTVPFSATGFILQLPVPGVYYLGVTRRDTGRKIGELCIDGHDFAVDGKETYFTEANMCRVVQSPVPTVSESPSEPEAVGLSTWMLIVVTIGAAVCIVALISLGCWLMKRKKHDPDRLLLATGSLPDSEFNKQ
jgi:hypothetical protein